MRPPPDAEARRAAPAVSVYADDALAPADLALYRAACNSARKIDEIVVPPRDARTARVPAGHFFRIVSVEGPQVGDLNLWAADNLEERFYSGKTRALHGTHVGLGDRLWSGFPYLRPMATITADTLGWYGFDADGGGVHDVIGTRGDPYHHCCHSNLTRALAAGAGLSLAEAEPLVHDVLNVFMCTGFQRGTGRYFMKASPVRPGDYLELFAEIDLLAALSTCPGGDCGQGHSSDAAQCHPLRIDVLRPAEGALAEWRPPQPSDYDRSHGTDFR